MKKKLIITFTLFTTVIISSLAQTDTTLQKLLLINYAAYSGHKVDSLVKNLPIGANLRVSILQSVNYGNVLEANYPNGVCVRIKVDKFKYMNPYSRQRNWKVSLFKKETIAYTVVYQNNNCYVGCEHDPRSSAP